MIISFYIEYMQIIFIATEILERHLESSFHLVYHSSKEKADDKKENGLYTDL